VKKRVKQKARGLLQSFVSSTLKVPAMAGARNIDPYVYSLVSSLPDKEALNDPEFFVGLLRDSFMPYRTKVKEIKRTTSEPDRNALRFRRLIETLETAIPPLRAPLALQIAGIADEYLGNSQYHEQWGADVAWHFRISSSFPKKGRLLDSLVRFLRPVCCVEAGTAYGMSALFVLSALENYCEGGRLYTVEAFEPQYSLSSSLLTSRFDTRVRCYRGLTGDTLNSVVTEAGNIDFFIHDAGHSRDDYVNDFNSVVNNLGPGSIVLFDDIRWDDPRFSATPPRCYDGWRAVASHPRVCHAVEVGSNMGLLRLS
jgi:predicted O-methyltransferase YrrM